QVYYVYPNQTTAAYDLPWLISFGGARHLQAGTVESSLGESSQKWPTFGPSARAERGARTPSSASCWWLRSKIFQELADEGVRAPFFRLMNDESAREDKGSASDHAKAWTPNVAARCPRFSVSTENRTATEKKRLARRALSCGA